MSVPLTKSTHQTPEFHSGRIADVIRQISEIAADMSDEGWDVETRSLTTILDDLQWQYEDLIDKELITEGARRPFGAITRTEQHAVHYLTPSDRGESVPFAASDPSRSLSV